MLLSQIIVLVGFALACFIHAQALLGFIPSLNATARNRIAALLSLTVPTLFHFIPFFVDGYDLLLFAGITGCSFGILMYRRSKTFAVNEQNEETGTGEIVYTELLGMLLVYALGAIALVLLFVQLIVTLMEQNFPLAFYI